MSLLRTFISRQAATATNKAASFVTSGQMKNLVQTGRDTVASGGSRVASAARDVASKADQRSGGRLSSAASTVSSRGRQASTQLAARTSGVRQSASTRAGQAADAARSGVQKARGAASGLKQGVKGRAGRAAAAAQPFKDKTVAYTATKVSKSGKVFQQFFDEGRKIVRKGGQSSYATAASGKLKGVAGATKDMVEQSSNRLKKTANGVTSRVNTGRIAARGRDAVDSARQTARDVQGRATRAVISRTGRSNQLTSK
jgi:hypothetical protein